MRRLEIGSGNRPLPGYEHLDIDPTLPDIDYVCSMLEIPVEDDSFDEIVSIHSIEHVSWRDGRVALKEWYRILKPNGLLTVATPNLRFIAKAYLDNGKEWYDDFLCMHPEEQEHLKVSEFNCHVLWANFKLFSSQAGGDEHKACYDAFLLTSLMTECGFKSIRVLDDGSSLIIEARKAP